MSVSAPALDGVLLINKPAGMTSHDVVYKVRKHFNIKKVGHGGTLDPMATGLLILLLGPSTRKAQHLLGAEKTYQTTLRLGATTDTQDAQGQVLKETPVPELSETDIELVFQKFLGTIDQKVPAYSAVKFKGKPFYKLARAGQEVPERIRQVDIKALKLMQFSTPEIQFEVVCSSGTYVRTLCEDIASELECGGHMAELSRTRIGAFSLEEAATLETMTEADIRTFEELHENTTPDS